MSRLRALLSLLISLSKIIPYDRLFSLLKSISPLPKTPAEVVPWLTGIGVADPLLSVLSPVIEELLADDLPQSLPPEAGQDFVDLVESEAVSAQLDPETVLLILEVARRVFDWWKNRKA